MSSRQPWCVAGTRGGCREKKACTVNSAREAWHSPSNIVVATPYEGCGASVAAISRHVGREGGHGGVEREQHEKGDIPTLSRISSLRKMVSCLLSAMPEALASCARLAGNGADLSTLS